MCGIAGVVYEGGSREPAMTAVRHMIEVQHHRGPDGNGFYDDAGVSLGHCRLAIIDLTTSGDQPMADIERRYWITFNGEIYNYIELREELKSLGCRFRGESDTEVLLNAYCCWGEACVDRLRGMFAFAVWDQQERCLFAARDRLGIKPFHYWTDGNGLLAFASELKALLHLIPEPRPNVQLATDFLAWNLLDHEPAETMIVDIKRLPAAHAMRWRPGVGLSIWQYWRFMVNNDEGETSPGQRDSLVSEFRALFRETISLHLRSDVPVGTCLSGGLDSSSIVCVVKDELRTRGAWRNGRQHTFTACFDEPSLDERPYVEEVARATGCQTHFVFPRADIFREELDRWIWHQEEPAGSSGVYAQYCVARLAREHGIKVLLDGQGADEQLAGYRKFILVYLRQLMKARQYAHALKEGIAFLFNPAILRTSSFVDGRRYLLNSVPEVNLLWPSKGSPVRPADLGLGDSLARRLEADMTRFSLPLLLRFEDRNTMAFGVESRVPFVDHILVEWLAKLPTDMRLADGWTKVILRRALVGTLPESIRVRKSKLNFSTPESKWISGPLARWLRETLEDPRHLADVVEINGLRQIVGRHGMSKRSAHFQKVLFRLAIYETWARQFLGSAARAHQPDTNSICQGTV
jgi:asparagine synthase (glutamine-hydrolysing)